MSAEQEEMKRVDFKVYDMPVELKNKYVSMAKLDYDNNMWEVLKAGMEALSNERQRKVPELETKVDDLQKQIVYLKTRIESLENTDMDEKDSSLPKTFGDQKKEDSEDDGELLNRFANK